MHPGDLSINDFTYELPEEKIAKYPLAERDSSRLLIFDNETIREDTYRNIADHISVNSLMVFNNTRVIPARILFKKITGGIIEIFCLEPAANAEYTTVMNMKGSASWKCMIGGASKWKEGPLEKKIMIGNEEVLINASLTEKLPDAYVTSFRWQPAHYSFAEIIEHAGAVPLPPYIKRDAESSDTQRYQTIYAEHKGSVAAPTAGLHFTPGIFDSLKRKNIQTDFVTLHVGAGTFKPVKAETMAGHEMHAEWIDVSVKTINNILANAGNVIAVGTTSLRTLESLYWMGVKCMADENIDLYDMEIDQWEVYEKNYEHISARDALSSLVNWMNKKQLQHLITRTQILIAPGYHFRICSALVTNFHQPRSTLLLLVAAITPQWKTIYNYALENDFRFLSYGDGCLLRIKNIENDQR